MDSHEQVEVAIGVGSLVIGALFTLWVERRRDRMKKAQAAYKACLKLQETLRAWMDTIKEAAQQPTAPEVLRELLDAFNHQHFETQIGARFYDLEDEPLCKRLFGKTNAFTRQAFESKGLIAMALVRGDFLRDYPRHRDEAINALQGVYKDFGNELETVIPLLRRKARL